MNNLFRMICTREGTGEQFTAYFITRENQAIEGIVCEKGYSHISFCIKGVYMQESGEIAFVKVSCPEIEAITCPCVFVFEDTGKGYCSEHELFRGFNSWDKDWLVKLEKVEDDILLKKVATKFKQHYINLSGINKQLIAQANQVIEFF